MDDDELATDEELAADDREELVAVRALPHPTAAASVAAQASVNEMLPRPITAASVVSARQ